MDEIKQIYKEIRKMENEVSLLQEKIHKKYGELTKLEKVYYSQVRICYACKRGLLSTDKDIYCDYCLNGDTEEES